MANLTPHIYICDDEWSPHHHLPLLTSSESAAAGAVQEENTQGRNAQDYNYDSRSSTAKLTHLQTWFWIRQSVTSVLKHSKAHYAFLPFLQWQTPTTFMKWCLTGCQNHHNHSSNWTMDCYFDSERNLKTAFTNRTRSGPPVTMMTEFHSTKMLPQQTVQAPSLLHQKWTYMSSYVHCCSQQKRHSLHLTVTVSDLHRPELFDQRLLCTTLKIHTGWSISYRPQEFAQKMYNKDDNVNLL